MNEISELQAVDFSLGAHIAGAFAGYADVGPDQWRNFIKRPINKQVIRHDSDTPQDFLKDYVSAQKGAETTPTGTTVNSNLLPIVYYFRKPGFVNTQDQKSSRRRVVNSDATFQMMQLPLSLDYTVNFVAFDKPTLDKLLVAWYAWITRHDAFYTRYQIGGEHFDMRCLVQDNNNVILSNASFTEGGNRIYAASSTYTINTNILVGQKVTIPPQRLIFGFERETEERYTLSSATLDYAYDSASRETGVIPFNPGTVRVLVGTTPVAVDDGHGVMVSDLGTGTVDYYNGTFSFQFTDNPTGVVSVEFAPLLGRISAA